MAGAAAARLATTPPLAAAGELAGRTSRVGVLGGQARAGGPRTDRKVRRAGPGGRARDRRGAGRVDGAGGDESLQRRADDRDGTRVRAEHVGKANGRDDYADPGTHVGVRQLDTCRHDGDRAGITERWYDSANGCTDLHERAGYGDDKCADA
ncbi:hypothetical protein PWY87_30795 [Kribbella solani]|uniref:hypothetical protein n=1 Tax=Kribbella solani TaxID=236067 RepID=UPI0029A0B15D|nr:hypothetical protein [Kribbella solani]MDX3006104.1 hypothetical protein [Kribbella solani]